MSALFGMQVAPAALGDVALGLAGVLGRLDRLLEAHAPLRERVDELGGARASTDGPDDATFALLGLVALRVQLGRMLDEARATPTAAAAATAPLGGSLLR